MSGRRQGRDRDETRRHHDEHDNDSYSRDKRRRDEDEGGYHGRSGKQHRRYSKSPDRDTDRRRFRSRSPMRDSRHDKSREEDSRSGRDVRDSSRREKGQSKKKNGAVLETKDVVFDAELSAEEIQMMAAMGIPFGFDTTQGKHVDDENANEGAVKVASKRSSRQYMNRKTGFNRPLPAERTGQKVGGD